MIPKSQIPTFEDLLGPTLKALEGIGGSASIQELSSRIATDMALPDKVLDLKDLGLGVSTKTVQEIIPEPEFFEAL